MANYGGYYKGEKKKSKQNKKKSQSFSNAPIFTLPKIIEKKSKSY